MRSFSRSGVCLRPGAGGARAFPGCTVPEPPPAPSESANRTAGASGFHSRGMCAVGIFAKHASRGRSWARRPGNGASRGRGRPARTRAKRPEENAGRMPASEGRAVPRTPCPRKRLRGVKSAEMPLEPTPNRGRTPSPWGKKYLAYRPPPSISIGCEQRPGLAAGDASGAGPVPRPLPARSRAPPRYVAARDILGLHSTPCAGGPLDSIGASRPRRRRLPHGGAAAGRSGRPERWWGAPRR